MKDRAKILFLIHDLGQGGAEKVLVNLVNNMDQNKFDITVHALFDVGENKQFLAEYIHYSYTFKKAFRGNSKIMKLLSPEQLHKQIIKEKYDIEVAYLEGPCARIISGCTEENTKLVSWIHIEQHTAERVASAFRSVEEARRCYSKFDKIISVSKTVEQDFKKVLKVRTSYQVIYNTNESEKIKCLAKEEIRNIQFLPNEIKLVGVGKLLKIKGFDRTLRVANQLIEEGYPIHIYLLGEGTEENNLKKYAFNQKIQDKVSFLGYQINPYKYIAKSDLFVCASYAEGFSTAATEALIVGTPIITTLVSGMKEMLGNNNEYGIIVENSEEALYKGIKELLDIPGKIEYYKKQAQIRGRLFSTEKTVQEVEKMLLSL